MWKDPRNTIDYQRFRRNNIKKRCETCGAQRRLVLHHIIPVKQHPELLLDPANVKTLCKKCHEKLHKN